MNALDPTFDQPLQGMLSNVGFTQNIYIFQQNPRDVQGHVSLADNDSILASGEIWVQIGKIWKAIVPAHKLPSRMDAAERRLARNAQGLVCGGAVCEDDGVVVAEERLKLYRTVISRVAGMADGNIADKGKSG